MYINFFRTLVELDGLHVNGKRGDLLESTKKSATAHASDQISSSAASASNATKRKNYASSRLLSWLNR